jgi:hypothetical protein
LQFSGEKRTNEMEWNEELEKLEQKIQFFFSLPLSLSHSLSTFYLLFTIICFSAMNINEIQSAENDFFCNVELLQFARI